METFGERLANLIPSDYESHKTILASIQDIQIDIEKNTIYVSIKFCGTNNVPEFTAQLTITRTHTWGIWDHSFKGPELPKGQDNEEKYKAHLRGLAFLAHIPIEESTNIKGVQNWAWLRNIADLLPIPDSFQQQFENKYEVVRIIGEAIWGATIPLV
jgi:hypothetical protein